MPGVEAVEKVPRQILVPKRGDVGSKTT